MIRVMATGYCDDWSQPQYIDEEGRVYVDVTCGSSVPDIHIVTNDCWQEPISHVECTIVEEFDTHELTKEEVQ